MFYIIFEICCLFVRAYGVFLYSITALFCVGIDLGGNV